MALKGNWNYPTTIRFGAGRIAELAEACGQLGIKKPLLVTDPVLAELEIVRHAVLTNEQARLPTQVFSSIRPNPVENNVTDAVLAYRQGGHDGIIAMGGGSALDVAKAAALMVGQQRPLFDFEDVGDNWTTVNEEGMAQVVAVPTTSGTGSEVGRSSVITDESDHTKKINFHPRMLPQLVIADPALTVGLPPTLTAAVGLDALGHNLEAFFAEGYHPMADGIALEGIRLVHQNLSKAVLEGSDLGARSQLMVASTMGATAFQKGLGAIHAMSHPVSATLDTHHGLTIAVFMPYVMAFNQSAVQERADRLVRYLGLESTLIEWIVDLRRDLGLPHTAAEIGVTEAMIPELSERALVDPTLQTNPLKIEKADLERLYQHAIEGVLP